MLNILMSCTHQKFSKKKIQNKGKGKKTGEKARE